MSNPKANFKEGFLPRLGHVCSWFKGTEDTQASGNASAQDQVRNLASYLPITSGTGFLSDDDKALASDTSL
jgi:hypothetical protein